MDLSDSTTLLSPVPVNLPCTSAFTPAGLIIHSGKAKIDLRGHTCVSWLRCSHVLFRYKCRWIFLCELCAHPQKSGLGPNHHPTESRSNFYCFINPTIIASASLESSATPWFTFASITTLHFAIQLYHSMIVWSIFTVISMPRNSIVVLNCIVFH